LLLLAVEEFMTALVESPLIDGRPDFESREYPGAILIVDDSPVDARLAASIVTKRLGMQAVYAHDGVEH